MTEIIYEPLGVADKDFHVTKSIDQCPPGLMMRELLKNAFEAQFTPEENGNRVVILRAVFVDEAPKLAIMNTGHGLTPDELKSATDLASSIRKSKGLDGRQNRGEGAKVASLPWNHLGFKMRSCHAGKVSEVLLRRIDDRYVRERFPALDDDGNQTFEAVWDVTDEYREKKQELGQDWTEVILLGQSHDQDTIRWPYGRQIGSGEKRTPLTEIFNRFYDFPDNTKVFASDALHGRKGVMELRPMARVIQRWGGNPTVLRAERVPCFDGIEIEYVHAPLQSGSNNVMGRNELAGDATRIALVWQDEMYGAKIGNEWRHVAAGYGVPYVHRELSIFIHLPDSYPVRDGAYRQRLVRTDTGEELECEDFIQEVRTRMPKWVRELVERALAPKQVTSMEEVEKALAERLRRARIRRVEPTAIGSVVMAGNGSSGESAAGIAAIKNRPKSETVTDPDAAAAPPAQQRQPKRPDKTVKAAQKISSAPKIIWLEEPELVEAEELTHRAAKYVAATNQLFMNALHTSVSGKLRDLEAHYLGQVDLEQAKGLITDYVRVAMALHVGTAVVHALAKQGAPDWTTDEIERACSTECLTIVAENSDHLFGAIRQRLGTTDAFKAARAI
ncbi:hypothetical protein [Methyloceanibacter sp.]|uniref:hypothetical protein n=1 Tax=Methyloceanibacter sp. TaxID=1965321 RepID=UPI003D6D8E84